MSEPLLEVRDLVVDYLTAEGPLRVVDGLSFTIHAGEALGLAGESGGGKSTALHAILRTLPPPAVIRGGTVRFAGRDVLALDEPGLRALRWREASVVFQSAMNALNPVLRISEQIADTLHAHERISRRAARARAEELLALVELEPRVLDSYAHQLSGGMRQRVVIAMALALSPRLILLDEPTTALDVLVEQAILRRLLDLRAKLGFSILLVTHDLPLMLDLCDTVGILLAGQLVEHGPASVLARGAAHPYTIGLMRSFPALSSPPRRLEGIAGAPPNLRALSAGCRFQPRCAFATSACIQPPPLAAHATGHHVACHHAR